MDRALIYRNCSTPEIQHVYFIQLGKEEGLLHTGNPGGRRQEAGGRGQGAGGRGQGAGGRGRGQGTGTGFMGYSWIKGTSLTNLSRSRLCRSSPQTVVMGVCGRDGLWWTFSAYTITICSGTREGFVFP